MQVLRKLAHRTGSYVGGNANTFYGSLFGEVVRARWLPPPAGYGQRLGSPIQLLMLFR